MEKAFDPHVEERFSLIKKEFFQPSKYINVERQLSDFIKYEIDSWKPDYIILVERKATAIFRALKDSKNLDTKLDWEWAHTISSSAIDQLAPNFFENRRLLIFDDMMMKGEHLEELLNSLDMLFPNSFTEKNLKICVFGIHQFSSTLKFNKQLGIKYPSSWYYRDLSTRNYEQIRGNIVRMLESSGSLLLDTEHLELRIKVKGHLTDLIDALSRTGKTVVFNSSRSRRNITVYYPQSQLIFDENLFPPKTGFKHIVKKCRVVQRHDDEFAIIPICYPNVTDLEPDVDAWNQAPLVSSLFKLKITAKNFSPFYAVGLIAALQVLRTTVKDLIASGFDESNIYLPIYSEKDEDVGYNLNHLRVMFPSIDLKALVSEINKVFINGKEWGNSVKGKYPAVSKPILADDVFLEEMALNLLQVMHYEIQSKIDEDYFFETKVPHPFGLTPKQIFRLAKQIGIEEEQLTSSLFDILIDKAHLVTHVEKRLCSDGNQMFVRTFEPDGEIINKKMKDITINYGLPLGYDPD